MTGNRRPALDRLAATVYWRLKLRLGWLPLKRRVTRSLERPFSQAAGLPARGKR